MKRAIKFRVWVAKYAEFKHWGFLDGGFTGAPTGSGLSIEEAQQLSQQFTGLRDKNGREIYEGDVVAWNDGDGRHIAGEVRWRNEVAIWAIDIGIGLTTIEPEDVFVKEAEYEIIGNIHENHELLLP